MDPCANAIKGSQLEIACNCRKTLEKLNDAVDLYKVQIDKQNNDQKAMNQWNQKKAARKEVLNKERKKWNNCVDGNLCNSKPDAWCTNDLGSGWIFDTCIQDDCGLYRRGVCKRSEENINSILNKEFDIIKPPEPVAIGDAPSGNNIQCCSQIFNDITADNVEFNKISQQCTQIIDEKINGVSGGANYGDDKIGVSGGMNSGDDKIGENSGGMNSGGDSFSLIIAIMVTVLLLLLFSSSIAIVFMKR